MHDFFEGSVFFGVGLTVVSYCIGTLIQKKFKHVLLNPLLIAVMLTGAVLLVFDIDYEKYKVTSSTVSFFLTPATVCLAIPLYEQFSLLKKNLAAVAAGILSGVISSLTCVFLLCLLFKLDHASYVTFLPKSITSAIGIGVCEELSGYPSITVAAIIFSGILGNMFCVPFFKLIKLENPIARGIAIGSSSHAIGTSKAVEIGDVEGAMSSLSIVVSGLITVVLAPLFADLI